MDENDVVKYAQSRGYTLSHQEVQLFLREYAIEQQRAQQFFDGEYSDPADYAMMHIISLRMINEPLQTAPEKKDASWHKKLADSVTKRLKRKERDNEN